MGSNEPLSNRADLRGTIYFSIKSAMGYGIARSFAKRLLATSIYPGRVGPKGPPYRGLQCVAPLALLTHPLSTNTNRISVPSFRETQVSSGRLS